MDNNYKQPILVIDFGVMMFSTFFAGDVMGNFTYWRYLILNSIQFLNRTFFPKEIILAIDNKSWRKDIFEYYKANRKHGEDHEMLYTEVDKFEIELQYNFPYKIIRVKKAEADDIIAVLCQTIKDEDIIISSSDKDFVQLLKLPNIKIYNPMKKEFVAENPDDKLRELIIKGDSGDGVPNILSDDDTLVTKGKRQKPFTKKKWTEVLDKGMDKYIYDHPELKKNFERNKKLVDLSIDNIPEKVIEKILLAYQNYKVPENPVELITNYLDNNAIEKIEVEALLV